MLRLSSTLNKHNRKIRTFERVAKDDIKTNGRHIAASYFGGRKLIFLLVLLCVCLVLFEEMISLFNISSISASPVLPQAQSLSSFDTGQPQMGLFSSNSYNLPEKRARCKHTTWGAHLVCDSNGEVCPLHAVSPTSSCCREEVSSNRYTCAECDESSHCCTKYEVCVSCCLQPAHLQENRNLRLREGRVALRGVDDFTWCSFVCQTSSISLLPSENAFRNDKKYCFMGTPPPMEKMSVNSDRENALSMLTSK